MRKPPQGPKGLVYLERLKLGLHRCVPWGPTIPPTPRLLLPPTFHQRLIHVLRSHLRSKNHLLICKTPETSKKHVKKTKHVVQKRGGKTRPAHLWPNASGSNPTRLVLLAPHKAPEVFREVPAVQQETYSATHLQNDADRACVCPGDLEFVEVLGICFYKNKALQWLGFFYLLFFEVVGIFCLVFF